MCGFIAQLVEHRNGIAEVTGSNPVEALIFFQGSSFQLLKLEIHCEDHISPSYIYPQFIYESFHILHVISLLSRENKNSQLTSLPMCGFIAQLVEHRNGIAEVTGSNPVEALIFFQGSSFQLLKLEIHCEDHISPSYIYPQFIYESFHILHVISLLSRENKNSQLTSLPMCGFIAQLVEHRNGIAEVTGSNPVEALIFFQGSSFQLLKLEIHCEDHISPSYISAVHI